MSVLDIVNKCCDLFPMTYLNRENVCSAKHEAKLWEKVLVSALDIISLVDD